MKILPRALILAAVLCGARMASATTLDYMIHGNSCVSTIAGVVPVYSQYGVSTKSTTVPIMLTCPVDLPYQYYTSATLQVAGWPRNTADPLYCIVEATDMYGNGETNSWTRVYYNNGVPSYNWSTLTPNQNYAPNYLSVRCHLPTATNTGISYLSSVTLTVTY